MFCNNLKNVYIDGLIQQIGDDAFFGCDSIENVYIKDLVHFSGLYLWTIYSSPLSYAKHMYFNGQEPICEGSLPKGGGGSIALRFMPLTTKRGDLCLEYSFLKIYLRDGKVHHIEKVVRFC